MASMITGAPGPAPHADRDPVHPHWPDDRPFREVLGLWKVAWLKPRHEKAFAAELRDLGLPHYLPLVERIHRRPDNGRVKKARVPLFPAYVPFAAEGSTTPLHRTGRILRILPVPDQERFVADLEAVRRLVGTGRPVEAHPGLQPGILVRITHGPLRGLTGPIERQGSQCRFWVHVEMFNRSVSVELPCAMLLPEE